MKKCFIYCRKSSEDNARQVQSIADQKQAMKLLALDHNLVIEQIFIDEKSAGTCFQREGFNKLIKAISKGKTATILTWKLDRLSRNPEESGILQGMLQRRQIERIITTDKIYLPEDNALLFSLEGAMANQYLRDLSKNVRRGQASKLERGLYPACAPMGYLNVGRRKGEKTIEPDPVIYPKLERLWRLLLTHQYQLADLYRIMKSKYPIYAKTGGHISFSSFHRIFRNPFYCGLFRWSGKIHSGSHRAMVTKSEFDLVQDMLIKKPKTRLMQHEFHYRGMFKCAKCGSCITAEKKRKFIKSKGITKTFEYYRCPHHKKEISCDEKPMSKTAIDIEMKRHLKKVLLPKDVLEQGIEYLNTESEEKLDQSKKIEALQKKITDINKRIKLVSNNIVFESDSECRTLMKDKLIELKVEKQSNIQDLEKLHTTANELIYVMQSTLKTLLYAYQIIESGLYEDRLKVIQAIGTNWNIKRKRLSFTPSLVCQAIIEVKKKSLFEPKKASNTRNNSTFNDASFIWRGVCKYVRNQHL